MMCPGCGVPEGSAYFTGNTTWRLMALQAAAGRCLALHGLGELSLAQSSGDALSDQLLTNNLMLP